MKFYKYSAADGDLHVYADFISVILQTQILGKGRKECLSLFKAFELGILSKVEGELWSIFSQRKTWKYPAGVKITKTELVCYFTQSEYTRV